MVRIRVKPPDPFISALRAMDDVGVDEAGSQMHCSSSRQHELEQEYWRARRQTAAAAAAAAAAAVEAPAAVLAAEARTNYKIIRTLPPVPQTVAPKIVPMTEEMVRAYSSAKPCPDCDGEEAASASLTPSSSGRPRKFRKLRAAACVDLDPE